MRRLAATALLAASCSAPAPPSPPAATTSSAPRPPAAAPGFVDVTGESGVTFAHRSGRSPQRYLPETMGSGVAILDADGDGRLDLYFVDGGPVPPDGEPPLPGGNRLYRNLGAWRFEDVTESAGVRGRGLGMGAFVADVEPDGDADLLVTGYGGATTLYLNDGRGTFRDATAGSGLADGGWTTGAAFLDFDRDGRLDVFVQRYARWSVARHRPCFQGELEVYCTPKHLDPQPSRLLRGRGDGTFEDVSAASGIGAHPGKGLGVVAGDFDADGDDDVYCANDTFPNHLFVNRGDGTFEEAGLASGAGYGADGREEAGMGVAAADLDDDGLLDFVVANFEHEPLSTYRNEGAMTFTEVSGMLGIAGPSLPWMKWGVVAADFDLDGDKDLAVANGHVYDNAAEARGALPHAQPGGLLLGTPGGRFVAATAAQAGALARAAVGRGLAAGDLDGDGDEDLVLSANGGPARLLRNDAEGSWLAVDCGPAAFGTRVEVTAGGRTQMQVVTGGGGYLSQSALRPTFGLGSAARADLVAITPPGGARVELRDVEAGRLIPLSR